MTRLSRVSGFVMLAIFAGSIGASAAQMPKEDLDALVAFLQSKKKS